METNPQSEGGVVSDGLLSDLFERPAGAGGDARLVAHAIRKGWLSTWDITPERRVAIVSRLESALEGASSGNDHRAVGAIAECARKMAADDRTVMLELINLLRLDSNKATENVSHSGITRIVVEHTERKVESNEPIRDPPERPAGEGTPATAPC